MTRKSRICPFLVPARPGSDYNNVMISSDRRDCAEPLSCCFKAAFAESIRALAGFALFLAAMLLPCSAAHAGEKPERKAAAPSVEFSHPGGFFTPPMLLALRPRMDGVQIRYTLDASEPGPHSHVYGGPISVAKACCVRARVFAPGMAPGRISSITLLPGKQPALPLLCLHTDPANLHNPRTGLFKHPGDRGLEWERPVHAAFYEPDGSLGFQIDAGLRLAGGVSRNFGKKSFRLYFREKYGRQCLKYPLFGMNGLRRFECIRVRASGNDQVTAEGGWTLLRDAINNELMKDSGGCATDVRFSLVALNGDFIGLYDLREHCNADFLRDKYGVSDPDLLKVSIYLHGDEHRAVKDGDKSAWDAVQAFFRDADFSKTENLSRAVEMIDAADFINEHAVRLYGCDWDWPQNNRYMFRDRFPGSRWRFVIWDSEWTFDLNDSCSASRDILADYLNTPDGFRGGHAMMFRRICGSPEFRRWFLTRCADLLNTSLSEANVTGRIRALALQIAPGIPFEAKRWGGSVDQWMANVDVLCRFAQERPGNFRNHLIANFPEAGSLWTLKILAPELEGGSIGVNTLRLNPAGLPWTGTYFSGVKVRVEAFCKQGYRFAGWSPSSFGDGNPLFLGPESSGSAIIARGSEWEYFAGGGDPGRGWNSPGFKPGIWPSGRAPLGYGEGDEATALSFGKDEGAKIMAYFFRRAFDLDEVPPGDLAIDIAVDDGAVVWINGTEAVRINMPDGAFGRDTPAAVTVGGEAEKAFSRRMIPAKSLKKGRNVMAVEVHQAAPSSSDLRFDLALGVEKPVAIRPVFEKTE